RSNTGEDNRGQPGLLTSPQPMDWDKFGQSYGVVIRRVKDRDKAMETLEGMVEDIAQAAELKERQPGGFRLAGVKSSQSQRDRIMDRVRDFLAKLLSKSGSKTRSRAATAFTHGA